MPRMIRGRLGFVGAAAVVTIVVATLAVIQMQRAAAVDAFTTATVNLGFGMTRQTQAALEKIDRALTDMRGAIEADRAGSRFAASVDRLSDWQKRLSFVDALLLADKDGLIAATTQPLPPGELPAEILAELRQQDGRGVVIGNPLLDRTSGRWTALMARRLDDTHGGFAGMVGAELSLTELEAFYSTAMPPQRSIAVLRRDGTLLARFPPRPAFLGRRIPADAPWHAMLTQGPQAYNRPGYFGSGPMLTSVHPLRDLPLVVEASVTQADVLAAWYRQRPLILAAGLCAIAGVILVLWLFAQAYRRVETSQMALDATLDNVSQGVCFFGTDGRVIVCNHRYGRIFGLPDGTIKPGMSLSGIAALRIAAGTFQWESAQAFIAAFEGVSRAGKPDDRIFELPNGRTISGHIEPLPGRGWVVTNEDITERRRTEATVAFLRHDPLTGLANRGLFLERLEQAIAMAGRGRKFALLYIDLDRFKPVNDTFGHAIGDALLRGVADRLRSVVRESDTIARLGGDEFAIVQLDVADMSETTALARRIVHAIEQAFDLDGQGVTIGASIGIAMAPGAGTDPAQVMKWADLALYRSKEEGRGTWRFFEASMDTRAAERRVLEADLRHAAQLGQLEIHYQAVVGSDNRAVHGFEALLRWRHPTRGLLSPGSFIPIAEEVGLIADIGAWVLRQACADAAGWPDHLRVAVNLSTRHFRDRNLLGTVTTALRCAGLPASRLELEITESVPLRTDQMTLATLHDLQALGIRIALDDFGTGYSSLSYLRGFPFDAIKIDQSFVADLPDGKKSAALVHGIIDLAAILGMSITAEGVESEVQFEFLASAGCTDIQGYLIGKPVPASDIPLLLERLAHPAILL